MENKSWNDYRQWTRLVIRMISRLLLDELFNIPGLSTNNFHYLKEFLGSIVETLFAFRIFSIMLWTEGIMRVARSHRWLFTGESSLTSVPTDFSNFALLPSSSNHPPEAETFLSHFPSPEKLLLKWIFFWLPFAKRKVFLLACLYLRKNIFNNIVGGERSFAIDK